VAGAAQQAVIAESLGALPIVVEGVEEEDGARALIESRQGPPVGGKAKILPLVFKGLVLIVQIPNSRKGADRFSVIGLSWIATGR